MWADGAQHCDALETASPENILLNTDKYPVVL